jgi:hypothetical protein
MTPELDAARARRYLLGEATDEERDAIELEYFQSGEALDRIVAAEDDLIDDYLSNRLDPAERDLFERRYLAASHHRRRVETVRQLRQAATRGPSAGAADDIDAAHAQVTGRNRPLQWLAMAAALIVLIGGSLWLFGPPFVERPAVVENRPPDAPTPSPSPPPAPVQPPGTPTTPRVFAVSLPPVSVRSGTDSPGVVIPAGTDVLTLHLEGEPDRRNIAGGRATIRAVGSDEVWQGPATVGGDLPRGVIARIEVPPARLTADDYIVTLFETAGAGAERERARYFLRVRAR